ncbi:PREDICTED: eukaryotic translation initiation factor 3 subunit A [Galeopterus variegatus]|uniref:Eukaryotic translation initiation factor 3 subunit A n=1 Tax=Galeopterus variegatus TaxID=482537 RepID=A0ABM0RKF5_GALVR|nr:PREDICTED: eukaryotic translation initiation factor 3 subunit A [Galeopterus variegatus]
MPAYFQRPENALKRANEFLEVGKKQPALDVLYDVMKSKKHRTWQKIHEPIMLKYLELCVDLRKSHLAKEGLYQYKNICQQVNIKSLEDVVRAYLKLAEEKTEAAKEESQQMVLDIEDLDNIQTPESVLLSAVSGEDTQDRTDRLLLTPWVKFLWESYRQCLDLLRNNSRVERLYHDIAQQAFKFCLQYTRKAEFRKLCDNLRMHLSQIQRHHNQSTAINLNNPESQSMHLETRLVQLDSAISMELWQEAFKAVEDIHGLFSLSKKPPKPQLMANYYNKVSTVFWKSGNALFHASTLHRLYHLSREMRKNLTQDEMQRMSTRVLLATLSIPITPERTDIARLLDMDGIIVEKQRRLATLLGLQAPPTRIGLINDMVRFNVLQYVVPEVKDLYNWLEVEFNPLKLCERVTKVLNWVREQPEKEPELQQYVPQLQNNTILRLLQQDLEELDPDFIMAKQVEQLEKEKKELQERLKNQEKKIDYFERAKRLEEIPLIKSAYEEQRIKDMDLWEQQEEERITTMQLEREKALEHKNRMSRMLEDRDLFVMRLKAARQSVYEEKLKQFEERLAEERRNRLEERKRQRKEERRITYYREKEEEEQRRAEEQMLKEREERERAERAKREEELREYQERVKKLEEVERKKRQRELEIEERERRREEERRLADDPLSRKVRSYAFLKMCDLLLFREWRRGEGRDEERPHRRDEDRPRRVGDDEERESSLRPDDDRIPRRGMDDDRGPRRGPDEDRFSRRPADDDRPSWRNADDDRPPRRIADDDRPPRRIADEDRGSWRHADDDRPPRRLDEDRGSWRTADEDRGPRRGIDEDRGLRRGAADEERSSWRNADDDRGPRRSMDDDRGPRRSMDDDRGPRRSMDDDRGPRRGLDDDRGPWRNADDDRVSRRSADDDRGPWRNMDDDRIARRGDDDRIPRRGDDSRPGPWRPFVKPGGWREKEKAREESWGPPRELRPSEEREWDREKERDRDNQDREENDKDPERERDRERDGDREDRFRRPRALKLPSIYPSLY